MPLEVTEMSMGAGCAAHCAGQAIRKSLAAAGACRVFRVCRGHIRMRTRAGARLHVRMRTRAPACPVHTLNTLHQPQLARLFDRRTPARTAAHPAPYSRALFSH